ncbi:uncharacterized protein LOC119288790 isoform X1 [Triticum dicoccoides]|uniref:uncharacterized protein LOC119288790 isoform X1 n=1 Tax=Triticum dicoccoides TaxID=85692 RepID=UPI00188E2F5C|nr:uncharacterized protein LOC119288790 isoform X1 [Triticum dicoccoides]
MPQASPSPLPTCLLASQIHPALLMASLPPRRSTPSSPCRRHHRGLQLPRTAPSCPEELPSSPTPSTTPSQCRGALQRRDRVRLQLRCRHGPPFDPRRPEFLRLPRVLSSFTVSYPETDAAPVIDYFYDDTSSFSAEQPDDGSQEPDDTTDDYYYPEGAYYYKTVAGDLE